MIAWQRDDDGVVTLTMDDPDSSVNTMNQRYLQAMGEAVDRLEAERETITGVVIASAKKSFFAGGDLAMLREATAEQASQLMSFITEIKAQLRRLETLGRPVVAALAGSALGGGLEIALACHHRIAVDAPRTQLGLPEVTLGLLPGAGGVSRTVRMLGLQTALSTVILTGAKFSPRAALEAGLLDELVVTNDDLVPAAKAWIAANSAPVKSWDAPGFRLPGGSPSGTGMAGTLAAMPALLRKQLKGAPLPAPRAALAAAVEGALLDIDTALLVESRYFVNLVIGQVSKNMIGAFFFDLQQIAGGASRPAGFAPFAARKVGVLGAGMMGAGIAYVAAKAGIEVVLKDVTLEAAQRGKAHAEALEAKALERGSTTAAKSAELLGRIRPTADAADFAGIDLVIEAVFEDVALKQGVIREVEGVVQAGAVLGSNTSTLPITELAQGVTHPAELVGIHFFSPVHKMPLVEIVRGAQTSPETLAKAFDFVLQLRKTPIVVNDSRGFFTSRVIATFMAEAIAAVGEGVEPASVEQAALQAGYPTGALQLVDELTLSLTQKIQEQTRRADADAGRSGAPQVSEVVVTRLIEEFGRRGRSTGAGFYDYDESGRRLGLWPGLREAFTSGAATVPFVDLQERMLFAEALETVRCIEEGVLESVADANIGSIYGIGFPAWTGGVLQYINQYEGGLPGFVARSRELALGYGQHFEPPALLLAKAEAGETFV